MNQFKKSILPTIFIILLVILNFYLMFDGELYGPLYDSLLKPAYFFINQKIQNGIYPFFFNSLNGLDLIGESQIAALFPTNIFLYFFDLDIDTKYKILIFSYIIIGITGIYFLFTKKSKRNFFFEISLIAIFVTLTFFRVNLPHQFFIGAFIIFLVLNILYILKLSNKIENKNFIIFGSIAVALLLLVGNLALQWLFLTALTISIIILKLKKKNIKFLILISPLFFGFGLASIQIFLTADLMLLGDRSVNILDFSKFNNFSSPYILSSLFNLISAVSMESFNSNTFSGFEITDNAIFLGLFPLIIFISDLYRSKDKIFEDHVKFFLITMMLIVFFRSLGGFFLPNIILTSLPIFGQMRALFRDLITLEILIFLYFLYLYFKDQFLIERKVFTSILFLSVAIFFIFEVWRFVQTGKISLITFFSLVGPVLYYSVYRIFKRDNETIYKYFFIICIIEISLVNFIYPSHLGIKEKYSENAKCDIPLNFKPSKNYNYEKRVYFYDHTLYHRIFNNDPFEYKTQNKLKFGKFNNENCPNIHLLDQATLTPVSLKYIIENYNENPILGNLLFDLIFHHDKKFSNEEIEIESIYDLKKVGFKSPILNNDKVVKNTFNLIDILKIKKNFLIEKNYNPIKLYDKKIDKYFSVIPYGNKRIIVKDSIKNNLYSKTQYGSFYVLNENVKSVNIYYIPVIEVISLIVTISSAIFLFFFVRFYKK